MAVKADPAVIREMAADLRSTINTINGISSAIRSGCSNLGDWDDSKQAEFTAIMLKMAQLTEEPVDILTAAIPKLENLASSLDSYGSVSFHG